MNRRSLARLCAVALLAAPLAACGTDDEPAPASSAEASAEPSADETTESGDAEGVTVEISLTHDGVEPQGKRVEVEVGQPITLKVTSEIEDEVHVHSEPDHTLEVKPGDSEELTFSIDRPGQVAVESHHQHVTIVQLVVR